MLHLGPTPIHPPPTRTCTCSQATSPTSTTSTTPLSPLRPTHPSPLTPPNPPPSHPPFQDIYLLRAPAEALRPEALTLDQGNMGEVAGVRAPRLGEGDAPIKEGGGRGGSFFGGCRGEGCVLDVGVRPFVEGEGVGCQTGQALPLNQGNMGEVEGCEVEGCALQCCFREFGEGLERSLKTALGSFLAEKRRREAALPAVSEGDRCACRAASSVNFRTHTSEQTRMPPSPLPPLRGPQADPLLPCAEVIRRWKEAEDPQFSLTPPPTPNPTPADAHALFTPPPPLSPCTPFFCLALRCFADGRFKTIRTSPTLSHSTRYPSKTCRPP